jgi:hypothetical protein
MIPVWRYWTALLLCMPLCGVWSVTDDLLWRFVACFVYGVAFGLLLRKYTKRLVEVER